MCLPKVTKAGHDVTCQRFLDGFYAEAGLQPDRHPRGQLTSCEPVQHSGQINGVMTERLPAGSGMLALLTSQGRINALGEGRAEQEGQIDYLVRYCAAVCSL